MDKCKRCGADLPANAKFCTSCGEKTGTEIPNVSTQNVPGAENIQGSPYPPYAEAVPSSPAPAYTAYREPPKKKRWWIPLVIILVVLAILAGVWFAFGNSIKSLFLSDNQKWQKAEKAAGLIPEDSLLYELKTASTDILNRPKAGYETEISFDIKADALPDDMAGILTVLSGMRFNVLAKTDLNETDPHFYTRVALAKRGESSEALSAEIFDAGDYLLIGLPEILSSPLAIHKDFLSEALDDSSGLSLTIDDSFGSMGELRASLGTFFDEDLDEIIEEIKEIFITYAQDAELVKGEELTIGSVSQKLDYYIVSVSADDTPAMMKEILILLRDNKAVNALISELSTMGLSLEDSFDPSEEFVDAINEALAELEDYPEDFRIEIQRKLYVDKKNNAQGGEFILKNLELDESISLSSLHVIDGSKHAQKLKLVDPYGMSVEYKSEYTLKDELYTGSYTLTGSEAGSSMMGNLSGSFSDFGLKKADNELYPVGTLSLTYDDPSGYTDPISLKYEGKVEAGKLTASLSLGTDADGSPISFALNFSLRSLPDSELKFKNEMPADYIDLSDEDALMGLMMDETIMTNLMSALEDLGIDLNSLLGFDDFDDDF